MSDAADFLSATKTAYRRCGCAAVVCGSAARIGSGAMLHEAAFLKRLNATVFLIVQSAGDRPVETACGEVGLNAGVNGLGANAGQAMSTVLSVRPA